MAKSIVDLIPVGKANAIERGQLHNLCKVYGIADSDREMRRLIQHAKGSNVIMNMQDGSGYFRPGKDDKEELRHYIMQEAQRSITILQNLKMAKAMLEDLEFDRL